MQVPQSSNVSTFTADRAFLRRGTRKSHRFSTLKYENKTDQTSEEINKTIKNAKKLLIIAIIYKQLEQNKEF